MMPPQTPTVRLAGTTWTHDCRPAPPTEWTALVVGHSWDGKPIEWQYDDGGPGRPTPVAFCPRCGYKLPETEDQARYAAEDASLEARTKEANKP